MKEERIIVQITPKIRFVAERRWTGSSWAYFPYLEKRFWLGWLAYQRVEVEAWQNIYGISEREALELAEKIKTRYLSK